MFQSFSRWGEQNLINLGSNEGLQEVFIKEMTNNSMENQIVWLNSMENLIE